MLGPGRQKVSIGLVRGPGAGASAMGGRWSEAPQNPKKDSRKETTEREAAVLDMEA